MKNYEKEINRVVSSWDGSDKELLVKSILTSLRFIDCSYDNCLHHRHRNAINCSGCVKEALHRPSVKNDVPPDMVKGTRHGLLVLTGNFIVDEFQSRRHQFLCDCGATGFRIASYIRKHGCCEVKKHPERRKQQPYITRKSKLNYLRNHYLNTELHNHIVTDVIKVRSGYSFVLKCLHCGRTVTRNAHRFINKKINGCTALSELDILKRKEDAIIEKQKIIDRNKGLFFYKDLVGRRFGKLTVIKHTGFVQAKNGGRNATFLCKCDCGETWEGRGTSLTSGSRKYCNNEILEIKKELYKTTLGVYHNNKTKTKDKTFRKKNDKKLRELSALVYDKYNGVCQKCKTWHPKNNTNNHHIIPISQNKNLAFTVSNGMLLCIDCHETFHKKYGYVGFNPKDIFEFMGVRTKQKTPIQLSIIYSGEQTYK